MRLRPMPVVMVSSLTQEGAEVTLRALELGAVDFVAKPKLDVAQGLAEYADEIVDKVRAAALSRPRPAASGSPRASQLPEVPARLSADAVLARSSPGSHFRITERVISIGASTGGTEAIKDVLRELPPDMPGIVVKQHIPEAFSAPFARRLDATCALTVVEARDGQPILPGHAYVAPGNRHLRVVRDGARLLCRLNDGPAVNRHKPSVDVMFRSLAQNAGRSAVAVVLTGMGADGAAGTGEMKAAGARVVAQDERTSVVWGMPAEVVKRGYADDVLPLPRIAARLVELARNSPWATQVFHARDR
jgi:two-component system chemotaxis response regulator CheB